MGNMLVAYQAWFLLGIVPMWIVTVTSVGFCIVWIIRRFQKPLTNGMDMSREIEDHLARSTVIADKTYRFLKTDTRVDEVIINRWRTSSEMTDWLEATVHAIAVIELSKLAQSQTPPSQEPGQQSAQDQPHPENRQYRRIYSGPPKGPSHAPEGSVVDADRQ